MNNKVISLTAAMILAMSTYATAIRTDRTWYLAGEAMEVSVTDDDALIAYAELCDLHGLVAGAVISLKGGEGTGIVELPPDLHSGYYVLSVYTRYNADVSHCLVAVINALHKSADDDIKWVAITHPDSLSYVSANGPIADFVDKKDVVERETEGHIIKARIKNVYDGKTYIASQIHPSLSIVGKQIHYFEGKMVNDSLAVFYTFGIHGRLPLVLSAMSSTDVNLPIEMISPFAALLPKQLPHLIFNYKRSEVEARSLDMQRHQIAIGPAKRKHDTAEEVVPLDYEETVLGTKPDLTYNLDEYRQFYTIREVLLEYVSCVKNIKMNGVQRLIVRREQDVYNSSLPTLVLIDGMPVNDIERLLNYDARRIHYINIYATQYTFGNGVYNGILSFVTRSGRLTNYPIERNMQYLVYDFPR